MFTRSSKIEINRARAHVAPARLTSPPRGESMQTIVVPRVYMYWGMSHRAPKRCEWHARSGLRLKGHHGHGIPFHRARAVLLYLGDKVLEQGRAVTGTLAEIVDLFDIGWPVANLEKHFLSVVYGKYECSEGLCVCRPMPCTRIHRVAHDARYCHQNQAFRLLISLGFYRSVLRGVRCPLEPVAALIRRNQFAALDLLVWYSWRLKRTELDTVDALGAAGPFQLITTAAKGYRQRKELIRIHRIITDVWPNCPFQVSTDGNRIVHKPERPSRTWPPERSIYTIPGNEE